MDELRDIQVGEEKIILITTVGQDYIEKFNGSVLLAPLDMHSLEKSAKKALSKAPQHQQPVTVQPPGAIRPLDILLVEDNKANCMLIQLFFKDMPHTLRIAHNGEEGSGRPVRITLT